MKAQFVLKRMGEGCEWVKLKSCFYFANPTDRDVHRDEFPEGLHAFGVKTDRQDPYCVDFMLRWDSSGVNYMPVLVAADYLRERGWDVELPEWCK